MKTVVGSLDEFIAWTKQVLRTGGEAQGSALQWISPVMAERSRHGAAALRPAMGDPDQDGANSGEPALEAASSNTKDRDPPSPNPITVGVV